jgi:hypothetical protein
MRRSVYGEQLDPALFQPVIDNAFQGANASGEIVLYNSARVVQDDFIKA